jgi:FkbM family methyltransferase
MGTNIGHKFPFLITAYFWLSNFGKKKDVLLEVNLLEGSRLLVATNSLVGAELSLKGTFEQKETDIFLSLLKEGDTFVDIGANIGYYTVIGAKLVGNVGRVIAIEPDSYNLPILAQNIKLNVLDNVEVIPIAVGNQEGTVSLSKESDHAQSQIVLEQGAITMRPLTSILQELHINKVNFLKIDTEGAEKLVLQGATPLLEQKNIDTIFIEINAKKLADFNTTVADVFAILQKYFTLTLLENQQKEVDLTVIEVMLQKQDYVNVLGKVK